MIQSQAAKTIATKIQGKMSELRREVFDAIEQAVVGRDEVPFILQLLKILPAKINSALTVAGVTSSIQTKKLHQKPRITYRLSSSQPVQRCELGDLLFVVKYVLPNGDVEVKSVVYQVKSSAKRTDRRCKIDQTQLTLLREWPPFSFGKDVAGNPQVFTLRPRTLEFGSYMLMMRRPGKAEFINKGNRRDYGIAPNAWRVEAAGPSVIDMQRVPFSLLVSTAIVNQLAFILGEPHSLQVQALINALYRFGRMAEGSPDEFDGFYITYPELDEGDGAGAFCIIEVCISLPGTEATTQAVRPE